jgi:hypothetical protein
MVNVPDRFRPHIRLTYPPSNTLIFEEWFYTRYQKEDNKSDRVYLPIFPTSYQVNNKYGKDKTALQSMERYLRALDRNHKYFTICQFDDGLLFNVNHTDLKVFGMGGGRMDVPLPLVCMPHPYEFEVPKTVFASFFGALTHPIRTEMFKSLDGSDYVLSSNKVHITHYCEVMAQSTFALCPRGYGVSSFRICEALQYGAIPVYISDEFILPFDEYFDEYGVTIHRNNVSKIDSILKSIPLCEVYKKREAGKIAYKNTYSYEGLYNRIMKSL